MSPASCVVLAAWLTLGVLAGLQPQPVMGYPSKGSSLEDRHSSRLSELVRIASHLNHERNHGREKRLITEAQSAWDRMYDKYRIFHSKLSNFVNDLLERFKPGSPFELRYITIIPRLMPVNDPDFLYQKEDEVVSRVFILFGFTEQMLRGARQYVLDSQLDWYDKKTEEIRIWMSVVQVTLTTVRLAGDTEAIDYYKAGIGDINVGFDSYPQINLQHLRALLNVI